MDNKQLNDYIKRLESLVFFVNKGLITDEIQMLIVSENVSTELKHQLLRHLLPTILECSKTEDINNFSHLKKFNPLKYEEMRKIIKND
ncbi:hypothetical protein ACQ1PF_10240 [Ornithobacterium rhinotracheale]